MALATLRLFVYGSLKRDQANHAELRGARFVTRVRTAPWFALREIAGYPALVSGHSAIEGELFELPLDALDALDEFEGEGYQRREITLEDGSTATSYFARSETAGLPLALTSWRIPK